jgi:putative membrane protein
MLSFIIKFIVTAVLVFGLSRILPGVELGGVGSEALLLIVLGILNAVVRPILSLLSLPITILTLGLFSLVINVVIILLADWLMDSFNVHGFLNTLLFSLGLAVVNAVVGLIFDRD